MSSGVHCFWRVIVFVGGNLRTFISLSWSISQSADMFEKFLNIELTLDNVTNNSPIMTVSLGDFNVKSLNWYKHTLEIMCQIWRLSLKLWITKIIDKPTHNLAESSSCIDLLFTSNQGLLMDSRVHLLLHSNCHHQIVYAKFTLKIHCPPPCKQEIWHYQQVAVADIRNAIKHFSWENAFRNLNTNDMVFILIKQSKIFYLTRFYVKLLFVMTKICLESIKA